MFLNEQNKYNYIDENIKIIQHNVSEAVQKYRKPDDTVRIMAVTKTVPYEIVNYAISKGINLLGENRVQEFLQKKDLYLNNCEINFIGHLQSNKIKYIINSVSLIHSVDSLNLAKDINRQAEKNNKIMKVLVEINIGNEESKSGLLPDRLEDTIYEMSELKNIEVCGLMTIPPVLQSEKYFYKMQNLFNYYKDKNIKNTNFSLLSMGMSADYVCAIKYGSNIVRIGTALFGARNYVN